MNADQALASADEREERRSPRSRRRLIAGLVKEGADRAVENDGVVRLQVFRRDDTRIVADRGAPRASLAAQLVDHSRRQRNR